MASYKGTLDQCDQIVRFLKVAGEKYSYISSLNIRRVLGYLKNITFQVKTNVITFWPTFGNIWATFYFYICSHCA